MNVLILSGFLGSGKTTILLQIAKDMVNHSSDDCPYPVMIIENEVGQQGVDDKLIGSSGFQVETLLNGCICCSLSGDLIPAISKLENTYHPEWLIIETTGLAYPDMIRKNLMEALRLPSIICTIVDASRWKRLHIPMAELLKGQLECADIVLLNKCDLTESEQLQTVEREVRSIQPDVCCYATNGIQPLDPEVLAAVREIKCEADGI